MKNYLYYILLGIAFILPGEFFLQISFSGNGLDVLGKTIISYTLFLTVVFFVYVILKKIIIHTGWLLLVMYLAWAFIGLIYIEWQLLGNAPWDNTGASQIGMLTWWGTLVLFPIIIRNRYVVDQNIRQRLIYVWLCIGLTSNVFALMGAFGMYIALIIFSYGTILYNYFVYKYIRQFFVSKSILSSKTI